MGLSREIERMMRIGSLGSAGQLLPGGSDAVENRFPFALLALRAALDADAEFVQEFLIEAREHLAAVESGALALKEEPGDREALNAVFRSFHTLKGLAGFLGATAIEEVTHQTENILDLARSGQLALSRETIDLILKSADAVSLCLDMARIRSIHELPRCDADLLAAIAQMSAGGQETGPNHGIASESVRLEEPAAGRSVRVESARLEYLIDMVGELVIAESAVRHDPAITRIEDPLVFGSLTRLNQVVREVQQISVSMRMVAVGTLFRKMRRLTRDLAHKQGKTIELITIGDDIELDRGMVEDLADPMIHMIRNAVDHGLEMPAERLAAGKPAQGAIRLRAMRHAGDIVIEISDDGRGMDPVRILARARHCGLVQDSEAPDEEAILKLTFEPGLSTAERVTDMSGRGVGLDVVRKQIEKLRGGIAIRSTPGEGCTFAIRLPLR